MIQNLKLLVGLDISSNYTESCKRFYYEKKPKPIGIFLRADTSKNILNGECCDTDFDHNQNDDYDKKHCSNVLSIIYDKAKPFDKEYGEIYRDNSIVARVFLCLGLCF